MTFRTYVYDRFSPYLDDDPWVDFFEDLAQRGTTVIATVLAVHVGLFFALSANFVIPDLKEEEPEPIPIQIIAFEDLQPEPEPAPEVIDIAPIAPPPPPAPTVRPRPKPTPQTAPPPPPPPVEEIFVEPEPQPIEAPPPPDILVNETPVETENTIPEFTPPEPIQEPVVEPVIEPPIIPEPIPQPLAEPIVEPLQQYDIEIFEPEPIVEPEPIFEPAPIIEPEPIIEPLPEPIPEPIIEEAPIAPIIETAPIEIPEPVEAPEPIPAPVIEPEVEKIETNPIITPPLSELVPEPVEPTEDIDIEPEIEDAPIEITAPKILASPDAPISLDEAEKAVPQEQAAPINDFLFNPRTRFPTTPTPNNGIQRPASPSSGSGTSGGAISLDGGGGIPGGGTQRAPSQNGNKGWALAPSGGDGALGAGGKGIVLDIRCREAKRTHADCPQYLAQFKGRNAAGYESFGAHSNGTVAGSTRGARSGTYSNPGVGGGRDPWSLGAGSNSVNAGGPSSTVLEDADFGREFLGTNLGDGSQPRRLRDLIKEPTQPWGSDLIELPQAPEEDDDEN